MQKTACSLVKTREQEAASVSERQESWASDCEDDDQQHLWTQKLMKTLYNAILCKSEDLQQDSHQQELKYKQWADSISMSQMKWIQKLQSWVKIKKFSLTFLNQWIMMWY